MMKYLNPYSVFMDLKNYLYDEKYFKQIQIDTKIISIGNLNTGGSGKTPLIRFVAEILKNKKILIVCKSYKATLKYPSEVNLTVSNAAQIYGDEACLLKQLLPGCDVWSGPSKSSTVFTAMLKRKYDIILIDDGFSHRKIFRHRDIVLIDASRSRNHYQLFPFGQMREDWKTLKRSDLVILTKTEGLPIEKIQFLKEKIKLYQPRWVCAYFKTEFETQPASKKLFLIAAIANPQKLKFDLVNSGYQILKEKIFLKLSRIHLPESVNLGT